MRWLRNRLSAASAIRLSKLRIVDQIPCNRNRSLHERRADGREARHLEIDAIAGTHVELRCCIDNRSERTLLRHEVLTVAQLPRRVEPAPDRGACQNITLIEDVDVLDDERLSSRNRI